MLIMMTTTLATTIGTYGNFCCDGVCALGGCPIPSDGSNVTSFYPVDDCANCTPSFDNRTTSITTSCQVLRRCAGGALSSSSVFCLIHNPQFCDDNGDNCQYDSSNSCVRFVVCHSSLFEPLRRSRLRRP